MTEDERYHLSRLIKRLDYLRRRGIPDRQLADLIDDINKLKALDGQEKT